MTISEQLSAVFPGAVLKSESFRDETTLTIQASALHDICLHLKEKAAFNYLIDISSVDHFGEEPRFEVVYELYSIPNGTHLRLKTTVSEDNCEISTVSDLWPAADWHEREAYDMMGIRFTKHPDLRRILMWEGFPYHPLRKDFPLEGKHSELPGVAFSEPAPLAGGPFVTVATDGTTQVREPRARHAGDLTPPEKFIAEP